MKAFIPVLLLSLACQLVSGTPTLNRGDDGGLTITPLPENPIIPRAGAEVAVACGAAKINIEHGKTYLITSPGFPAAYSGAQDCKRKFTVPKKTAVEVQCTEFDLKCTETDGFYASGDRLDFVYMGLPDQYCGNAFKDSTLSGFPEEETPYDLDINFVAEANGAGKGFSCKVVGINKDDTAAPAPAPAPAPSPSPSPAPAPSPSPAPAPGSSTCDCGLPKSANDRIVGGKETAPNQYPWQVALMQCKDCTNAMCGATIISKDYILTAAHCTQGETTYWVKVGEHDLSAGGDGALLLETTVINHKDYDNNTMIHDIALLKLKTPLTFTDKIRPACLPKKTTDQFANMTAIVSGWGALQTGANSPQKLHSVEVTTWTNQACNTKWGNGITKEMLCAWDSGKDSCQGDSGGPLYLAAKPHTLIGVVSFGRKCADPDFPGVYARVTEYINDSVMNLKSKGTCLVETNSGQT